MIDRRTFLRRAAAGAVLPAVLGSGPARAFAHGLDRSPFMRPTAETNGRIVVIIRLDGGADGLNTLVPYHDDEYYRARRRGLSNDISIHPERVVPISTSGTMGLHPELAPLASLFAEGKVAVVQDVGYENTVMSHFRSTEIWMSATDENVFDATGWVARAIESRHPEFPSQLPSAPFAIEFGTRLSTGLIGSRGDVGIAHREIRFVPEHPADADGESTKAGRERAYVESVMRQSSVFSGAILGAQSRVPDNRVEYPTAYPNDDGRRLGAQLAETARLIAAGLETQVYLVSFPFYDFHVDQLARENVQHAMLAKAVVAFQRDLEAFGVSDRVAIMTISEFGRRVDSTGTGTDHGGAAPVILIGEKVASGFVGHDPDILDLVGPGNLRLQFDFRQVYASVLAQWLGADDAMLGAAMRGRTFAQLPLFRPNAPTRTSGAFDADLLGEPRPNPVVDLAIVPLGALRTSAAHIALYSGDGRRVLRDELAPGAPSHTLDVRSLPAGSYVCEVVDGERRAHRTLVVAR